MFSRKRGQTVKQINGYLSRLIQNAFPDALVVCLMEPGAETWVVQRPGEEDLGLGNSFSSANQACHAIVKAEARRGNR